MPFGRERKEIKEESLKEKKGRTRKHQSTMKIFYKCKINAKGRKTDKNCW
jgi:hypothetical protein